MHVGQHGSADPVEVINGSIPCNLDEPDVKALKRELDGRGYILKVAKKHTQDDLKRRKDQLKLGSC